MVEPEVDQQLAARGRLHYLNNSVVDRALVLLQPVGDVVGHNSGVVGDGKVRVLVSLRLGLQEDRQLAKGCLQLLLKGLVSGLGEEGLLLQDGPDAHRLLKHDDGGGQVHAKVDHLPVDALLHVLLLLNDEHVVVEELLELLVDKVDGDLLEAIVFKDLKAGNVEHSAEVTLLQSGVNKGVVTFLNQPLEDAVVDGPADTTNSVCRLFAGLTLHHPLSADLDPGLAVSLDQWEGIDLEGSGNLSWESFRSDGLALSLVVTTLGLEFDASVAHNTCRQHVAVKLLVGTKTKHIEGILGVLQLFIVIDGVDLGLALGDVDVVVDVVAGSALGAEAALANAISVWLEQLVEDVVGPLHLLLLSDTGLLKQIRHDITTAKLARGGEVDSDELSEPGGVVVPRSLGVSVGLQDGVGGNNLVLKGDLLLGLLSSTSSGGHHGRVGDHLLGVLGLSGTRLTGDQHGVVLLGLQHVPVCTLRNGPQVRRAFVPPLAKVDLANAMGIERVALVGVHHNDKQAGVGVDQLGLVAGLQVPEDRSVVEVGQVDHVLALLKLGGVDTADLASLQGELLVRHRNGHLHGEVSTLHSEVSDVARLEKTLLVAVGLGVGDPDRGLRVVRLVLVLLLHVHGGP